MRNKDWRGIEAMVQAVERRWQDPDHGVWEARLPPRHHVYSKVMCWLTVDRRCRCRPGETGRRGPSWVELRERIRADVLEHGWNEAAGAYSVAYGDPEIDASSLWIGLSGLLPDDDPRFLATVLKVEAELRSGAVVYRYRWDDGLSGTEGGFHLCTAWLIEAYLRTGRRSDAEELFQQMLDTAGPTGLLPEQYDPLAERGLGNHPQAYSHLGLIRCATVLDTSEAQERVAGRRISRLSVRPPTRPRGRRRRRRQPRPGSAASVGRCSMGSLVAVALDLALELVQ